MYVDTTNGNILYGLQERLLIADQGLAAAEALYEITRSYVKERKAFGSTISSLQTVKHRLAEMKYVCLVVM